MYIGGGLLTLGDCRRCAGCDLASPLSVHKTEIGLREPKDDKSVRVIKDSCDAAAVQLPKAFWVRDDRELLLIQDLMARLNPKLLVIQVATGLHVNGGCTVNFGLVDLDGQPVTDEDVHAALEEAGLDFRHNAEIQASRIWVNNQPEMIEKTPA